MSSLCMGLGEAFSLASALVWAMGVILYRQLGSSYSPVALNVYKNLLVLLMLVPTVLLLDPLGFRGLDWRHAVIAVVSGAIGIGLADTLYFRALNQLGAGRMGVIGNLYSPFVILLSMALLAERLGPLQWLGFALVMVGVLLVTQAPRLSEIDRAALGRGILLGVLAILLMAVAIVLVKRTLESQPFFWVVILRVLGGLAGMAFVAPLMAPAAKAVAAAPRQLPLLILAAFLGQYLAMILWLAGYRYTDASIASVLNETASVWIVLMAWLFLGEGLDRRRILGTLCTLAGVWCMLLL